MAAGASRSRHTPTQHPVHHKEAELQKRGGGRTYVIESHHESDVAPIGTRSWIEEQYFEYTQRLSEIPVWRNGTSLPFQPRGGRRTRLSAFPLQQIQAAGRQLKRFLIDRLLAEKVELGSGSLGRLPTEKA